MEFQVNFEHFPLPALREALQKACVTATNYNPQNIKTLGKYKAYLYLQVTVVPQSWFH